MIHEELLQHVPGCENGDAPYSQELLGGGKVNRSFLVRTRRGRFVVRLNENAESDPGLDRNRELLLHAAAANAGIAPHVIYASPDRSCLITDYLEGRAWTPHYFTRMRDLRSLGARLRSLHAVSVSTESFSKMARFDPMAAVRLYAGLIVRGEPAEGTRIGDLLARGEAALQRSGSAQREACVVHMDLHHGNVLTADRIYFIDWEYAQLGDPLLDLACVMALLPACRGARPAAARGIRPAGTRCHAGNAGRAHAGVQSSDISMVSGATSRARRAGHRSATRIHRPAARAAAGARRRTSAHLARV